MHFSIRTQLIFFAALIAAACNNSKTVPFPKDAVAFAPPEILPLHFSAVKNITWDTIQSGGIQPAVSQLDIEALPAFPFDTTGFKPFIEAPKVSRFNLNDLPVSTFNPDSLPVKSLAFTTTKLLPPVAARSFAPAAIKNLAISMYDFGPAQGLQAKFVSAIYKDSNGGLWIGSTEGLFRYDGQYVLTVLPATESIPIVGITGDRNGNIWAVSAAGLAVVNLKAGTVSRSSAINIVRNNLGRLTMDTEGNIWVYNIIDSSVCMIDPATATYKSLSAKNGLSDFYAYEIAQHKNKSIWISTYANGAEIVDMKTGTIRHLTAENGLSDDHVSAIAAGKNGEMVIANNNGLDIVDIEKGTITKYQKKQGMSYFYSLALNLLDNGQIWRSTNGGADVLDVKQLSARQINNNSGLTDLVCVGAIEDAFKHVWIGTTGGLKMVEQFARTTHYFNSLNVVSLLEDDQRNIWVATDQGVIIIDAQLKALRQLKQANGLIDNFVQSFARSDGNMIVATNGGFNIIDPVKKTITKVGRQQGFPKDTIYSVFPDRNGFAWFTGPDKGVAMFDPVKNIVIHTDKAHGLSEDNVLDMRQNTDGKYWLVSSTGGVNVIDKEAGTVSYLDSFPGLKETSNKTILVDSAGRVWIGTYDGIFIADTKANTLTHITTKQGLSNNKILSLLEYNGAVYAGTNNKISIIKAPAGNSKTDTGWQVSILKGSEALIKTQRSWASDHITRNGAYLWGDAGITVLHALEPANDSPVAVVAGISIMNQPQFFTSNTTDTAAAKFYADRNIYKWDGVEGAYNLPVNLVLPHYRNYLQFQFGETNPGRRDTSWYMYMLEGIDKAWSAPTHNTTTENYLNLPAGKYTFKVSNKYANGNWGVPASFSFTIAPPWYQTWWAYTLYALLLAGMLRMYIVYRSGRLQKENKQLEEKVALRTSQLQKSLEDLKAAQTQLVHAEKMASLGELTTGIAHEIQNPLNFVNNFAEVNLDLLKDIRAELLAGNHEEVMSLTDDIFINSEKIAFHGKRADSIVKGMLLHSRKTSGAKEPVNVNTLADEYLRLAYHGLRAKDKSFNAAIVTDFDESLGLVNAVPQDIGRVILNLVNNAFYAAATPPPHALEMPGYKHQPTVWVKTYKVASTDGSLPRVVISVRDNGPGIAQKNLDKIFQPFFTTKPTGQGTGLGLSLSYDIVKAHGGEIKVETNEKDGTTFLVFLNAV